MIKPIMIPLIIAVTVTVAAIPCYGEYQQADENARVFEGTVADVNIGQSLLTVDGVVQMAFHISPDTKLARDIYDIKLSDIGKGDYVTVEYIRSGTESRVPSKVTRVTVEYDKNSGNEW